MKRNICFAALTACAIALLGTGCKNEVENYFEKSAAERMNDAVDKYSQVVASSPGGWVMEYYPTNSLEAPTGCGYLIMTDIRNDGSVIMVMNNDITEGTAVRDTSMWEIIKDYGPVLSFSTYNKCIHTFCDPAIYETGLGYEGDYEFLIINMEKGAKTAMLKGKKRGVYVNMSRVAEGTDYEAYLDDIANFRDSILPAKAVNYDLLAVGDALYKVEEINTTIPNIYPFDGDAIADESWHPLLVTKLDGKYHLRFRDAMKIDDNYVQEFIYNETSGEFVDVENSQIRLTGPDPILYFSDNMLKHSWDWTLSSGAMSEDLYEKYDAINTEGAKLKDKYSIKGIQFSSRVESDDMTTVCLDIKFVTSKRANITVSYLYELTTGKDGVNLKYIEPKDQTAANVLKSFPSMVPFLEAVQGTYQPKGTYTNFCMNDLTLAGSDAKKIDLKYLK